MMPTKLFTKGNPGGPGRPPAPDPVLDASIPMELAVIRAALEWEHKRLPKNPALRMAITARNKNPQQFMANWQKLEQAYRDSKAGLEDQPGGESGGEIGRSAGVELPLDDA